MYLVHFWDHRKFSTLDMLPFKDIAEAVNPLYVVIVCMYCPESFAAEIYAVHKRIFLHTKPTIALTEFHESEIEKHGPICIHFNNELVGWVGPSVGHELFTGSFEEKVAAGCLLPNWKSLILGAKFQLPNHFTTETNYLLASQPLLTLPTVLILHFWSLYCEGSIMTLESFKKFFELCPHYSHVIVHMDRRNECTSKTDIEDQLMEFGFSADVRLVYDEEQRLGTYARSTGYAFTPLTIIIVNGVVEFAGYPHIECDPRYLPNMIDTALGREIGESSQRQGSSSKVYARVEEPVPVASPSTPSKSRKGKEKLEDYEDEPAWKNVKVIPARITPSFIPLLARVPPKVIREFHHRELFEQPMLYASFSDRYMMERKYWYCIVWDKDGLPRLPSLRKLRHHDVCVIVIQTATIFDHDDVLDAVCEEDQDEVIVLNDSEEVLSVVKQDFQKSLLSYFVLEGKKVLLIHIVS
jgi:hypothetical protein